MEKFLKRALRLTLLALCLLCIGMTLLYAYPRFREYELLRVEARELEYLIEAQHAEQARIIREMENALTDAQVERVARERLGFVMSNEIIFIHESY